MKIKLTGKKASKIIRISVISLAVLLIITGISTYLLLQNYIHKMNLVGPDETEITTERNDYSGTVDEDLDKTVSTEDGAFQDSTGRKADITAQSSPAGTADDFSGIDTDSEMNDEGAAQEAKNQAGHPVMGNVQRWFKQPTSDNNLTKAAQNTPSLLPEDQNQSDHSYNVRNEAEGYGQHPESNQVLMEDNDVINLLLIGIDSVKDDGSESSSSVLFTVNKKTRKIITTSISNSSNLKIPGHGMDCLRNVYQSGGAVLLSETIEQNFRIKLNGYIMTDYLAYIDIVNTIGGVEMEVEKEHIEPVNINIRDINYHFQDEPEEDYILLEGTVLLNGKQALGYSRNWYSGKGEYIGPGKQKEIVLSIFYKVRKLNFMEINGFLNTILPHITTNLSEYEIMELILMLPSYFSYDMEQWSIPVKDSYKTTMKDKNTVLDIDLERNIDAIYDKLFSGY